MRKLVIGEADVSAFLAEKVIASCIILSSFSYIDPSSVRHNFHSSNLARKVYVQLTE
jgi:hypothetical protein